MTWKSLRTYLKPASNRPFHVGNLMWALSFKIYYGKLGKRTIEHVNNGWIACCFCGLYDCINFKSINIKIIKWIKSD